MSGPGEFPCVVKLRRRLHSRWCPSVLIKKAHRYERLAATSQLSLWNFFCPIICHCSIHFKLVNARATIRHDQPHCTRFNGWWQREAHESMGVAGVGAGGAPGIIWCVKGCTWCRGVLQRVSASSWIAVGTVSNQNSEQNSFKTHTIVSNPTHFTGPLLCTKFTRCKTQNNQGNSREISLPSLATKLWTPKARSPILSHYLSCDFFITNIFENTKTKNMRSHFF